MESFAKEDEISITLFCILVCYLNAGCCQTSIKQYLMQTVSSHGLNFKLLYTREQIENVIRKLALKINQYYSTLQEQQKSLDLIVVCVLKGAFMFFSDLVKEITHPHNIQFIKCKSYEGLQSSGKVEFSLEPKAQDFQGKNVLIVDDIHDTGKTLQKLIDKIWEYKPKTIDCAVLVARPDKPIKIDIKFIGLSCSDFIIGYGLDLEEQLRNLPNIYQKI